MSAHVSSVHSGSRSKGTRASVSGAANGGKRSETAPPHTCCSRWTSLVKLSVKRRCSPSCRASWASRFVIYAQAIARARSASRTSTISWQAVFIGARMGVRSGRAPSAAGKQHSGRQRDTTTRPSPSRRSAVEDALQPAPRHAWVEQGSHTTKARCVRTLACSCVLSGAAVGAALLAPRFATWAAMSARRYELVVPRNGDAQRRCTQFRPLP